MKLVDDIRGIWHHYSTIALGMAGGLQGVWASFPESLKTDLPGWVPQVVAWVTFVIAIGGIGGKFIAQTPKEPTP